MQRKPNWVGRGHEATVVSDGEALRLVSSLAELGRAIRLASAGNQRRWGADQVRNRLCEAALSLTIEGDSLLPL
jgi:hypothetical protein